MVTVRRAFGAKYAMNPPYRQDRVFVLPLPRDLADLKARIIATVKNSDAPMLTRVCVCVWQELEQRIDVCRVTRDAHIEYH